MHDGVLDEAVVSLSLRDGAAADREGAPYSVAFLHPYAQQECIYSLKKHIKRGLYNTRQKGQGLKLPWILRQEHTGPTVGLLKHLERLGQGREQICLVRSAPLAAFGAAQTLSDPTEHAKSEEVGHRTSEPLDSLIGGVLANQRGVWEGRN